MKGNKALRQPYNAEVHALPLWKNTLGARMEMIRLPEDHRLDGANVFAAVGRISARRAS